MAVQIDIESSPFLRDILNRGRAEGEIKGRAEGLAASLLHLLRRRFGAVPAAVQDRITQADPAAVEAWFDRAVDAPSLEAVFEPPAAN